MKRGLLALALAAAMALTGCSAMLERSYVSSTTHLDYSVAEDSSILRVETYQGLVNALLYFVNQHASTGTLRLYNYTGDVEADLESACNEVTTEDPLGVFCVRSMNYDSTRILTYYEVDVRITYSRSAQVVSSIQTVSGLSGLRSELTRAISTRQSQSLSRVSYFSGDEEMVRALFWQAYYSTPRLVLSAPQISVSLYPSTGSQRIVEVNLTWPDGQNGLEEYAKAVDAAVEQLLDTASSDTYTVEQLVELVAQEVSCSSTGSLTALDALSGKPSSDQGLLLGLEAVLQGADIETNMVVGSFRGNPTTWLIVSTPQGYRHLLAQSLHPDQDLQLYTDQQLTDQGYSWPTALYPACLESTEG